jgi:hypothetical protein
VTGDKVVDFEPVFDGPDAVFEGFADGHILLPEFGFSFPSESRIRRCE